MTEEGPGPDSHNTRPSEAAAEERRRRPTAWPWIVLLLIAAVTGLQLAGTLLRDRIERRKPVLAEAPPPQPEPALLPQAPEGGPSRFGPEVREVVVAPLTSGTAATEAEPESRAATARGVTASTPPAAGGSNARAQEGTSPVAPLARLPSAAGKTAGTWLLEVDTFFSQRYLRETEGRLQSLGVPYFLREVVLRGRGQRVTVSTSDAAIWANARRLLQAKGYLFRETRDALELFFYYPEEAQAAAAALFQEGVPSSSSVVDGSRPVWKLYAGPFSPEAVAAVRKRLDGEGIETVLRKHR